MTDLAAEQARLTGFVHSPQALEWGSSGFGVLLHLARVNHLDRRYDVARAFGIVGSSEKDISWTLTFDAKQKERFCNAIEHVPMAPAYWGMGAWQPFQAPQIWSRTQWRLRGCPSCFRSAFHTNLFQCPWVVRCPWHREALIEACRRCGRPLLSGFASAQPLLCCSCGWDPVRVEAALDVKASATGDRRLFFSRYTSWVNETFDEWLLLHPEPTQCDMGQALRSLVATPPALKPWTNAFSTQDAGCHIERWNFVIHENDHVSRLDTRRLAALIDKIESGGLAPLPWDGLPLSAIMVRLMCRVLLHQGGQDLVGAAAEAEIARWLALALPARQDNAHVDPCVLSLATRNALLRQLTGLLQARERGMLWWTAEALHHVCARLVHTAYADGVWRSLQPLVPKDRRAVNATRARLPWMLIQAPASGQQNVSIAWAGDMRPHSGIRRHPSPLGR